MKARVTFWISLIAIGGLFITAKLGVWERLAFKYWQELFLQNGYALFAASALLSGIRIIWRIRIFRETMARVFSQLRARAAFTLIVIYFCVGFLNILYLPSIGEEDGAAGVPVRLLDLIAADWLGIRDEYTYSSPLSATVDYAREPQPVNSLHILGTDIIGKDVAVLTLKGCSTALLLSFGSCLIAFPLAIFFGMTSGYFGRWVDDLITWLYSTISSIPFLLLVIALIMLQGRSLGVIIIAMGLTSWVGTCRLLRGETIRHKSLEYVQSARVLGAGHFRVILREIFPNVAHLIIIQFTLLSSNFIFAESILSFIGIGLEASSGSWGAMVANAQQELIREPSIWWPFFAAGFLGIFPLVLALNIFGDVARDALDPKLRNELTRAA